MEMLPTTWCRAWAPLHRTFSEIRSTVLRPSVIVTAPSQFGTCTCNSASLTKSSTRRRCVGSLTLLMATLLQVLAMTHKYILVIQWTKNMQIISGGPLIFKNLEKVSVVKTLEHEDKVVSVKWHPYLPLLLSTSADKTARIWYPQYNGGHGSRNAKWAKRYLKLFSWLNFFQLFLS